MLSVFEVNRRQHPVSGVLAFGIVEEFDVVEYVLPSIISGFVCPSPNALTFQQVEEALGNRIVMAIPTTTHAVFQIVLPQE